MAYGFANTMFFWRIMKNPSNFSRFFLRLQTPPLGASKSLMPSASQNFGLQRRCFEPRQMGLKGLGGVLVQLGFVIRFCGLPVPNKIGPTRTYQVLAATSFIWQYSKSTFSPSILQGVPEKKNHLNPPTKRRNSWVLRALNPALVLLWTIHKVIFGIVLGVHRRPHQVSQTLSLHETKLEACKMSKLWGKVSQAWGTRNGFLGHFAFLPSGSIYIYI